MTEFIREKREEKLVCPFLEFDFILMLCHFSVGSKKKGKRKRKGEGNDWSGKRKSRSRSRRNVVNNELNAT